MSVRPSTGNLPAELSSFVDRRREISVVRRLLGTGRLVTLTGVGGVGKTRLALRAAADARRAFRDGVWLVELAGLHDPLLLPQAVAGALGISGQSVGDPAEVVVTFLADRQILIVLDNCEHLVPACALLASELLRAAPGLHILATSREAMRIPGEQVLTVLPLEVPADEPGVVARRAPFPALTLFAQRAAAIESGFELTSGNLPLVTRICQRLDGIPLAIELAAARLYALSLDQVAALIDDRFRLLTSGNRAALPRQQTLRAAVDWSFELCTKPERVLWVRASVFAGRFDSAALRYVCAGEALTGEQLDEALAGLVEKSILVVQRGSGDRLRYRLLQTLRAYGLERLRHPDDSDEACGVPAIAEDELHRRHRDYYLELASTFSSEWFGPNQPQWTVRMCSELPDLRTALSFCLDHPGDEPFALRLAGSLYYFWYGCGEIREGRLWLERTLAADPTPGYDRLRALAGYGRLLILQGAPAAAAEVAREALPLAREYGDGYLVSHVLQTLGLGLTYENQLAEASVLLAEAAATARGMGDNHPAAAFTTFALAVEVLLIEGDPARAAELFAESRAICRAHGDLWWLGNVLCGSVMPALAIGEIIQARAYGEEALRVRRELRDTQGAASAVEFLAWVAAASQEYPRAARLLGATSRQWQLSGGSPFGAGQWLREHEKYEAGTRAALGAAYEAEFEAGGALTLDEAVGYALGDPRSAAERAATGRNRLTRREQEIAALVTEGLSNRQIATRLVISQRTAETHVENILSKFGFTTRTQIAFWHAQQRSADR